MPRQRAEFWTRVRQVGDCWEWAGTRGSNGYGLWLLPGRVSAMAHRVAYEEMVGPIPEGLSLDHLCRNRACVNPDHLEPVTVRVNNLRGESPWARNARKTHCLRGHEYTPDNTAMRKNGTRACRVCLRASTAKWRASKSPR